MKNHLRDNSMIRERLAWELSMQPNTARIPHMATSASPSLSLQKERTEPKQWGGSKTVAAESRGFMVIGLKSRPLILLTLLTFSKRFHHPLLYALFFY